MKYIDQERFLKDLHEVYDLFFRLSVPSSHKPKKGITHQQIASLGMKLVGNLMDQLKNSVNKT